MNRFAHIGRRPHIREAIHIAQHHIKKILAEASLSAVLLLSLQPEKKIILL